MAGVEAHCQDRRSVGLNAVQRLVVASPCVIDVYSGCILVCNGQFCLCLSFLHDPKHTRQSRQLNLCTHAYIHDTMNICEHAGWSYASALPQHDVQAAIADTWSGRLPTKTCQFFKFKLTLILTISKTSCEHSQWTDCYTGC